MFGAPKFLLTDNGSEFIARTLVRWLKDQDVQSRAIDPGGTLAKRAERAVQRHLAE
jgi:transposase InsO family protein